MIGCPFITQNSGSQFDVLLDHENEIGSRTMIHRNHEYNLSISVNTPKYPFTRQLPPAVVYPFSKFAFLYFDNMTLTTNWFRVRNILFDTNISQRFFQSVIVFGDLLRLLYKNWVPYSPSHQKYITSTRSVRCSFEVMLTYCTLAWGISSLYHHQYS